MSHDGTEVIVDGNGGEGGKMIIVSIEDVLYSYVCYVSICIKLCYMLTYLDSSFLSVSFAMIVFYYIRLYIVGDDEFQSRVALTDFIQIYFILP